MGSIPANKLNKSRENRVNLMEKTAMKNHKLRAAETSIYYRKVTSALIWAASTAVFLLINHIANTAILSGKKVTLSKRDLCTTEKRHFKMTFFRLCRGLKNPYVQYDRFINLYYDYHSNAA